MHSNPVPIPAQIALHARFPRQFPPLTDGGCSRVQLGNALLV